MNITISRQAIASTSRTKSVSNFGNNSVYDWKLYAKILNKLLARIDPAMDVTHITDVRHTIQELLEQTLAEENVDFTARARKKQVDKIIAEVLGLGPIQPLIDDSDITGII